MAFLIPLKFKDGTIVRNIEQLKETFVNHFDEILIFIETGQLERFFEKLSQYNLKELIQFRKNDEVSTEKIGKELANVLGVELDISDEYKPKTNVVSLEKSLKDIIEGEKSFLHFPSGKWHEKNHIIINSPKKITGYGKDKTAFLVRKITIDVDEQEKIEIKSLSIKNIENSDEEVLIEVLSGEVIFEDVIFENTCLLLRNKSKIKLLRNIFYVTPKLLNRVRNNFISIILNDNTDLYIDDETNFEKKIEIPISYKSSDISIEIKRDEFYEKRNKYNNLFSSKWLNPQKKLEDLQFENKIFDLGTHLKNVEHAKLSGIIQLITPVTLEDGSYTIEGIDNLTIFAETDAVFLVNNGATLELNNVKIESKQQVNNLIEINNGNLNLINCELFGDNISIYGNKADFYVYNTSISGIFQNNIKNIVIDNSNAKFIDCRIINCNILVKSSSFLEIRNCQISRPFGSIKNIKQIYTYEDAGIEIINSNLLLFYNSILMEGSPFLSNKVKIQDGKYYDKDNKK